MGSWVERMKRLKLDWKIIACVVAGAVGAYAGLRFDDLKQFFIRKTRHDEATATFINAVRRMNAHNLRVGPEEVYRALCGAAEKVEEGIPLFERLLAELADEGKGDLGSSSTFEEKARRALERVSPDDEGIDWEDIERRAEKGVPGVSDFRPATSRSVAEGYESEDFETINRLLTKAKRVEAFGAFLRKMRRIETSNVLPKAEANALLAMRIFYVSEKYDTARLRASPWMRQFLKEELRAVGAL